MAHYVISVGADALALSRDQFERRSRVPGTVPYWAWKKGKVPSP
jgi:hypothetical protein